MNQKFNITGKIPEITSLQIKVKLIRKRWNNSMPSLRI